MSDGAIEFSDEDDRYYSILVNELAAGHTDKAVAAQAFAKCGGEPAKAKAAYYRMRVDKLKTIQNAEPAHNPSATAHEPSEGVDIETAREEGGSIPTEIQDALRQAHWWLDRLGSVLVDDTYRAEHNRLGLAFDCQFEGDKIGAVLRKHGLLPNDSALYVGQGQDTDETDTATTIVGCTNCQQKLRVPIGKVLDITCPNCKRVFRQET